MKKYFDYIKQWGIDSINLMKHFKWGIFFYFIYFYFLLSDYLDPPAEDDPILRSEGSGWEYTNREVYIETSRIALMAAVLWFFFSRQAICAIILR